MPPLQTPSSLECASTHPPTSSAVPAGFPQCPMPAHSSHSSAGWCPSARPCDRAVRVWVCEHGRKLVPQDDTPSQTQTSGMAGVGRSKRDGGKDLPHADPPRHHTWTRRDNSLPSSSGSGRGSVCSGRVWWEWCAAKRGKHGIARLLVRVAGSVASLAFSLFFPLVSVALTTQTIPTEQVTPLGRRPLPTISSKPSKP